MIRPIIYSPKLLGKDNFLIRAHENKSVQKWRGIQLSRDYWRLTQVIFFP